MARQSLDIWDEFPPEAKTYFKNFGWHFNKKACEDAVKHLKRKNPATGKSEPIEPKGKEDVEQILAKNGVRLEHNTLYDFVWVYNMLMSDNWKSSIEDEAHLCKAVKDMIDDVDHNDGFIFNRWVSDRLFDGIPIDWAGIL